VLEIRPRFMVMENVPEIVNMLTPEGVPVVDALARVLADGGFGGYDALKRSLLASSGAGAAARSDAEERDSRSTRSRKKRQKQKKAESAEAQLTFDEVGA
jgi:hypothetical protein